VERGSYFRYRSRAPVGANVRAQSAMKRFVPPLLSILATLILLVLAGAWQGRACLPYEIHTFKWQCEFVLPFLALSFALPAAIYGYWGIPSPWVVGTTISIVATSVAAKMSYLAPFFSGPNTISFAVTATFFCVLPGLLGALSGARLRARWGKNAL